jgi:hypothetical protein
MSVPFYSLGSGPFNIKQHTQTSTYQQNQIKITSSPHFKTLIIKEYHTHHPLHDPSTSKTYPPAAPSPCFAHTATTSKQDTHPSKHSMSCLQVQHPDEPLA